MNLRNPNQLTKLAIDVDQWRRDIRTFAETTNQALGAIVAEFSTEKPQTSSPIPASSSFTKRTSASSISKNSAIAKPTRTAGGQDRLAQLKSQLAERIAKTNGSENSHTSDGTDA